MGQSGQAPAVRRSRPVLSVLALLAVATVAVAPSAGAAARKKAPPKARAAWTPAPAETAAIRPGVQVLTVLPSATDGSNQCTANFVFSDGVDVFLGQAAHCSGTGAATDTDGCTASSLPLGTPVDVVGFDGTTYKGNSVVYSSWLQMQAGREGDPDICAGNDFALVKLTTAAAAVTNPSVPFWGGPSSGPASSGLGDDVYTYGNSGLRAGIAALSPKVGKTVGQSNGGWTYDLYTVSPGVPGDSGSGFMDQDGRALGVLSTLSVLPLAGSNQVADLAKAVEYMKQYSDAFDAVNLVAGTVPFTPLLAG